MMQRPVTLSVLIVSTLYLSLCPASLYGAPQMGDMKADKGSAGSTQSVTGCLQKGDEPGGVTITGEDGKVWELESKKVPIASHVGHTVTVTGTVGNRSKAEEQKTEDSEKKESGEKEHGDLRVSTLKMISDTCSK
jgi:hypothetical protein